MTIKTVDGSQAMGVVVDSDGDVIPDLVSMEDEAGMHS
jgi:hypothetical protein